MIMRSVYLSLGWMGVILAVFALVIPVIPAIPFLLLAAYGFSRSSERFHAWVCSLPGVGVIVVDWERARSLARSTKWLFTTMIVPICVISTFLLDPLISGSMLVLGTGGLVYIWTRIEPAK